MRYRFLKFIFFFCFVFNLSIISSAQNLDTIAIIESTDYIFHYKLLKGKKTTSIEQYGHVSKLRVKRAVKDFPELKKIIQFNFYNDMDFVKAVVNCYNDYQKSNPKPIADAAYFRKFQIISRKESKAGPTEEMLKVKQPIKGSLTMITTTSKPTDILNNSTYGEQVRVHFTYGNSGFYNSGFMMKNLRKVMKDDPEAIAHLNKYRTNFITKRVVTFVSIGLFGLGAATVFAEKPPFGLTDNAAPFLAGSGVILFFSRRFIGPDRLNHLDNAIKTYNTNIEKNKK